MAFVDFNALTLIESLRPGERTTGTELYNALRSVKGFPVDLFFVTMTKKQEFLDHLKMVQHEARTLDHWPILHVEIHGNQNGLGFTNGSFLTWDELVTELRATNVALKNHLVITLAVCKGAYILRTIQPQEPSPFFGIIGSFDEEDDIGLRAGFGAFYQSLFATLNFNQAHAALRTHLPTFRMLTASDLFRRAYDHYRKTDLTPDAVEKRINAIVTATQDAVPTADARKYARQQLIEEDENRRQEWWRRFVMADLDPRNATRCPLPPSTT